MAADRAALDRDIAAKNAEAEARISALKAQSGKQITVIARDAASAVIDRFLGAGFDKADIDSAVSERVGR
jgi:F-type H+-transporting ATPase subunit b